MRSFVALGAALFVVACGDDAGTPPGEDGETSPFAAQDGKGDNASASGPTSMHLRMGLAKDSTPDDDYLLERLQYVASYSQYLNGANWVAWRLAGGDYGDVPRYDGNFISDQSLPSAWYHPKYTDYRGSSYDAGHMVRSEERTASADDNKATFILSNVLPQTPYMNRGPWLALERYAERLARLTRRELYIYAGGVWSTQCLTHAPRTAEDGCSTIGREASASRRLSVPQATFKIIACLEAGAPSSALTANDVIAVVMPNEGDIRREPWTRYLTTVRTIEEATGYNFFSALPSAQQAAVETTRNEKVEGDAASRLGLGSSDADPLVGCGIAGDACASNLDCCWDSCIDGRCSL